MQDFKTKLKNLREQRNLTQGQVAIKLGVRKQRYIHWEAGRCEPDVTIISSLATLFNVTVEYLIKDES